LDNYSTHGSLGPDALNAFSMNKSDGGKQWKQKDTIIPISNPDASCRGKVQKMTTEKGEQKGLQTVLQGTRIQCEGDDCKVQTCVPY
jgi:hypothetical protein